MTEPNEFQLARRLIKESPARWEAIGQDIFADHREVGHMKTAALARLVAAMHNVFLTTTNQLIMALRRLNDIEELEKKQ